MILLHFTILVEIARFHQKSAVSTQNAKFTHFHFLTEVGPKVTILEAKNLVLEQHFRPWARN